MRTLRSLSLVSLFKKGLLVETWGHHQRESQGCVSKQEVKAATPRSSAAEGRRGTGMQEALGSLCFAGARLQVSMDHVWGGSRQTEAGVGRARPRQGGHR